VDPLNLQPSTVFAGDFRVIEPLGQGGMGAIYVVEQVSTGKHRALKLMLPQLVADAALRKRFEQEARVGSLIESEHVVEVVGAGVDAATHAPWIAMELLVGDDLSQVVARRGAFAPSEVLFIFEQLCHAVGAAHRAGVVHRDLKPENIFMARSKRAGGELTVKVLDFGIAKIVAEAKTTRTAAVGSPMWMAPEQTDGSRVGFPADVWALGLVAFHLLTGRFFWTAANGEETTVTQLLREILFEPIPSASARAHGLDASLALPAGFDDWFARCVVRDPAARYPNADEAIGPLRAVLSGQGQALAAMAPAPLVYADSVRGASGTMAPSANTARGVPSARRVRLTVAAVVGAIALGIAGVILAAGMTRKAPLDAEPRAAGSGVAPMAPTPDASLAAEVAREPAAPRTHDTPPVIAKSPPSAVHSAEPARASVAVEAGLAQKEAAPAAAPCISEEQVQKIVKLHLMHLNRSCFERAETAKAAVNVTATLTIGPDGLAQAVTTAGDDPSVAQCVEGHLRAWHFPAGCTQKISIPLRFPLRSREE
jgi:eukaryotic-like serine/threonine-protein kinase